VIDVFIFLLQTVLIRATSPTSATTTYPLTSVATMSRSRLAGHEHQFIIESIGRHYNDLPNEEISKEEIPTVLLGTWVQ
jgi:hypothetical protein